MRTHPLRLIVAAAVTLTSSGIGATAMTQTPQEQQPAAPASPSAFIVPSTKNPYAKLFQPRPRELRQLKDAPLSEPTRLPTVPPGTHEPQVECKIRVIPAHPSKDRGIRMSKPSAETQFAIRILEHPCLKR